MSKSWAAFWVLVTLPLVCGVSCSGRVSGSGPILEDAGSAGMPEVTPEHDSGLKNTECAKLTVGQCAAGKECQVLEAQLQAPRCASEFEAVDCASALTGCGAAETRAQDPQGRQWLFLSTCIPSGWKELPASTPDACGVGGAAN